MWRIRNRIHDCPMIQSSGAKTRVASTSFISARWQLQLSQGAKHRTLVTLGGELCGKSTVRYENLNISLGTTFNICRRFEESGSVNPTTHEESEDRRRLGGQQELWLMGLLLDNPSLYLGDLSERLSCVWTQHFSINSLSHHS